MGLVCNVRSLGRDDGTCHSGSMEVESGAPLILEMVTGFVSVKDLVGEKVVSEKIRESGILGQNILY